MKKLIRSLLAVALLATSAVTVTVAQDDTFSCPATGGTVVTLRLPFRRSLDPAPH